MVVLYYGHTPVLKYLLRSGFDVDATDKNGRTTLIYSTSRYFIDDAKLLIERKTFFNMDNNYFHTFANRHEI